MRELLVFAATGIDASVGGIASANSNIREALRDVADRNNLVLKTIVLNERPNETSAAVGHGGRKIPFSAAILRHLLSTRLVVFDHVHLSVPISILPMRLRPKLVIFAHGSESWKRLRRTSKFAYQRADLVITNSDYTLRRMRSRFAGFNGLACPLGLPLPFVGASPTPRNLGPIQLSAADGSLRAMGEQAILIVSRLEATERRKGHRELLRAFCVIANEFPRSQLVIVGSGTDAESLSTLAVQLGIADRTLMSGFVDRPLLDRIYAHCAIFAMPSSQEGFGLVYLEAMAHSKPCIACHDDGGADIVVDNETGFLLRQPVNVDELADRLRWLLSSPNSRTNVRRGRLRKDEQTFFGSQLPRSLWEAYPIYRLNLLSTLRSRAISHRVKSNIASYRSAGEPGQAQLDRLNGGWNESLRISPWARVYQQKYQIPDCFRSWSEFTATVPVFEKSDLRHVVNSPVERAPRVSWYSTGGSTGVPVRFPVLKGELAARQRDIWTARSWLGITPADRLFLLWGHSHLLGRGFAGAIKKFRRELADLLFGYVRVNAYNLSNEALRSAAEILLKSGVHYVVGYSGALDRFARVNLDRSADIYALKLKAVIATGESFPFPDSRTIIESCFGAPVRMEYGTMETGPLAYEVDDQTLDVLWLSFFVETLPDSERNEVLLTTLYPRALPLLRYRIGDSVQATSPPSAGLRELPAILGRSNPDIVVDGRGRIHPIAVSHAVREFSKIVGFQLTISDTLGTPMTLRYQATSPLDSRELDALRGRLSKASECLAGVRLEQVPMLTSTIAGKTPTVLYI